MSAMGDWMTEVGRFNEASLVMHQQAARIRDVLIDQMTELVEATGDRDLMAGWAARLIIVADGDVDHAG